MNTVEEAINNCRNAFTALYEAIVTIPIEEVENLGEALIEIDDLRDHYSAVRSKAESLFVSSMDGLPEIAIAGTILEVRRADSRKTWAHKELTADLAERLVQMSVDMETGEIVKTPEQLLNEMMQYAGVSYWKIKALSSIGMSADDYCEVTEGPMKIRIRRP